MAVSVLGTSCFLFAVSCHADDKHTSMNIYVRVRWVPGGYSPFHNIRRIIFGGGTFYAELYLAVARIILHIVGVASGPGDRSQMEVFFLLEGQKGQRLKLCDFLFVTGPRCRCPFCPFEPHRRINSNIAWH